MKLAEAIDEVRKIAKRSNYDGKLTEGALKECAEVYLESCDSEGTPKPRVYMRSGEGHKVTHLSEMQWLIVRTPSFRSWFGKSVVVDENGDPKVMYHGSWKSFSEFKPSAIKLSKVAMTLWSGPGFYFTDKEKVATIYAGSADGNVYDVFLRLENPLIVDETGNSEDGTGISKKDAEKIFLDGDNTQWLDSGIANELVRMDIAEGVKGRGKQFYKAMTRQQRVHQYVARLKTDVVKLKTAALAYGAKSQTKLLESICRHTGHDGVIHTISPDVKEWVVYDPKAIKSANKNDGEFSTLKTKTEDAAESKIEGGDVMANLIESLRKIASAFSGSDNCGYKAVMDSLSEIGNRSSEATDAIDQDGKWITVHPNGSAEGKGRSIHLDKGGNIDSEGHLSNAIKNKAAGANNGEIANANSIGSEPKYKYFNSTDDALKYIQEKGKKHVNITLSQHELNKLTASEAASKMADDIGTDMSWSDRMKLRDEIEDEMMKIIGETGAKMKTAWEYDDELKLKQKAEEHKQAGTMTGIAKVLFEKEGKGNYEAIETAISKAKESGAKLQSRFEVSDYEDADEHHYQAMMNLVQKMGGQVLSEDSPDYSNEDGDGYGNVRGFTAVFPPGAAHDLFMKISVNDGYHGEMHLPTIAQ